MKYYQELRGQGVNVDEELKVKKLKQGVNVAEELRGQEVIIAVELKDQGGEVL